MVVRIKFPEASKSDLVSAGKDFFDRDLFLHKGAYKAWQLMHQAAKELQIELFIVSGFRSYTYQQQIVDRKLLKGLTLEEISKVNALPGESEHHTGRALDLTDGKESEVLTDKFETTEAFKWLSQNAYKFGFKMSFPRDNKYGYIYEPWHWCYQDEENK